LKNVSHTILTQMVAFTLVITCFTGFILSFVNIEVVNRIHLGSIFEDNYFHSKDFIQESQPIVHALTRLIGEYKNEEHILSGGTISEQEWENEIQHLYFEYQGEAKEFNPNLSKRENYERFKEVYADQLVKEKDRLIKEELEAFRFLLQSLKENDHPLYYASDGVNVYTNQPNADKESFKRYPLYMMFGDYKKEFYPKEIKENERLFHLTQEIDQLDPQSTTVYVAFTKEFLDLKMKEWQHDKATAQTSFYQLVGFFVVGLLSFIYLVLIVGRSSFTDREVGLSRTDKLFTDINLGICFFLIIMWFGFMSEVDIHNFPIMLIPITVPIAIAGLLLVLSLVRHWKNGSLFKHTLLYRSFTMVGRFVVNVYNSGNVGIKTVLIVIGYPIIVAISFFMFPITLGVAAWFAFKRVKSFQAIKEGVERIKDGDIHHHIEVNGDGEFAKLATDINRITDGLKKAVHSELKSERLKTELITNVSHDIRTPLTSIITYVDLLKKEKNPAKIEEYVDVLDQKSKRLKVLTDDLFEAAKASSGNIPLQFEKINIVALITQGIGEVSEKIEDLGLDFRLNHPKEKVFVMADGKLLWRSIENLLSNIFKYSSKGSRVYIDIEEAGEEILLTFKNISAYELNVSADDLMERFTRGDESRLSEGSGLGLSIAKSLIEIQKGRFYIQVDGDLFKSLIYMQRYDDNHE